MAKWFPRNKPRLCIPQKQHNFKPVSLRLFSSLKCRSASATLPVHQITFDPRVSLYHRLLLTSICQPATKVIAALERHIYRHLTQIHSESLLSFDLYQSSQYTDRLSGKTVHCFGILCFLSIVKYQTSAGSGQSLLNHQVSRSSTPFCNLYPTLAIFKPAQPHLSPSVSYLGWNRSVSRQITFHKLSYLAENYTHQIN